MIGGTDSGSVQWTRWESSGQRQWFIVADGRRLERDIGFAIVHAGGTSAPDIVVFAESGDMTLLVVRSLEGLNLRVDVVGKRFIEAGPIIAAVA